MFRRTLAWRSAARVAATAAIGAFAAPALCEPRQAPPTSLAAKRPASVVTFTGGAGEESHPSITLEYFALRGLGELPRLILEATGTPYHSVFHFGDSEYKEYTAFGQLPLLRDSELGKLLLVESAAIVRHLARRLCIDGATLEEKAKIDMYYELSRDIFSKAAGVYDPKHADAQKLSAFLFAAEEACGGEHFVGNSLTLADCAMFHTLYTLVELRPDALSKTHCGDWKLLRKLGAGEFAQVQGCQRRGDSTIYACKHIDKAKLVCTSNIKRTLRRVQRVGTEISAMRALRHK